MSKRVVCFGETMMRLTTPGFLRFVQTRSFDVTFAGAEANVAVSLANLGVPVEYVTRLPQNEIGDACVAFLRQFGIGTTNIVRGGDRVGIYFLETGAMQRGSKVIYDRAGSSVAMIEPGMVQWEKVFEGVSWFHWTGITPAISGGLAEVCLEGVKTAKAMGLTVSCDLNYRAKLWKWGKSAPQVMPELVKYTDIAIGNEEDAEKVFGIKAGGADITAGKVAGEQYREVAEKLVQRFPNLRYVAITLRGSLSASHNTWSGLLYDGKNAWQAPVYQLTHIVDRVGGGDAFGGGLIYKLISGEDDMQKALNFAVAASCLKHSVYGDFNQVSVAEIEGLMKGDASGRVAR
ncbi:MAG: PfkB family carbohydrate kinase [Syntrophobacteraceae bacterium]